MICVGESVEEAFYYTHIAVKACEYQVSDNLFMRKHCSLFHICRLSSVNSGENPHYFMSCRCVLQALG